MVIDKEGDLFESECDILCHQVNCQGVMGSGIAKQVRDKYPELLYCYKLACETLGSGNLGDVYFYPCIRGKRLIANLFGQDKYGYDGKLYTNYEALESCINRVYVRAVSYNESVAFPYLMGCDRGGGDWDIVLGMIKKYFEKSDIVCEIIRYRKD